MTLAAGFADPVRDAAETFRAVLDAMARPGVVRRAGAGLEPPAPLSPASAAALLTLADADAPAWLAPSHANDGVDAFLRFHAGAGAVPADRAAFAVGRWDEIEPLLAAETLAGGTPEYPDRSATLIVAVEALVEGDGARLTGPGIAGERRLRVDGLPASFWAWRARNRAAFPLGRDVVLTAGAALAALPRSVRAES